MIDISATLEAVLNSDDAWIETEPAFADVVFSFDEFDPKNPKLQILFQNGPDTKTWVTKGVYRIEHQCLLTVFVRPVNYKPATITAAKTSFLNMKSEVDRILTGVDSTFLSGWKDEPLQVGRDTGKMHNEPIMFRAIQTVMVTGYLLPGGEVMNCTDVRACLEGDYSTYAVYDSFDDATLDYALLASARANCLETKAILLTTTSTYYMKVYDIDAKTVSSSIELEANDYPDVYTVGCTFQQTLLNTYAAFIQKTTSSLLIYKNGVLLQTLTLTDLGLSSILAWAVSFSPRGKYIFITGTRVASGNKGWVVLVGS